MIQMDGPGPTWIGPFEPRPATSAEIERLGDAAERERHGDAGARPTRAAPQWTKLLFNACTNPLCALTGLTHGELCDYPPTTAGRRADPRGAGGGADALGIALEDDPAELVYSAAKANYRHRPSMLQDVTAHRPTEIATLNGGIVAAADGAGVDAAAPGDRRPDPWGRAELDLRTLAMGLTHT